MCGRRGAVHQPLIAPQHLALRGQRLDGRDAGQDLDDEAGPPVVGIRARGDGAMQRSAHHKSQQTEGREDQDGDAGQASADQPDQGEEDQGERQIDDDGRSLIGIEFAQAIDRGQSLEMRPGGFAPERHDIGAQQSFDAPTAGIMFEAATRPAGDHGSRTPEQAFAEQDADHQRDQNRQGLGRLIGNDPVIDLEGKNRQGRRQKIESQRCHQKGWMKGVQSRELMGWLELESCRFLCPASADELVGRESAKGLQALGEVVGVYEVAEMGS